MKKFFLSLICALLCTMGVMAENATMAAGTNGSAAKVNGRDAIKVGTSSKGGDMTITVGAGATSLEFYAAAWNGVTGLSLNITPSANVNPASVSLTADTGIAGNSPFTLTGTESNYKFTIALSDITEETTLTLTSSTTKRFVVWGATYTTGGSNPDQPTKTTPTLSFANPTYNATMEEAFTAPTLTNPENVTVSYASSETGVATVNASTGAVTLVAAGTTTITASFAGNDTYNANSASYNLVVAPAAAPALTTMDEIFAAATAAGTTATDCRVTFNNWVVSGVKSSNAYVTDNAGKGFIVYASGHGFEVGDILSGTAACKVQLYKGAAELTTLTATTDGLTVTEGGVVTPVTSIALASLSGVNTGAVVSYEGLTYNGTNFTDGTTEIKPYNAFVNPLPTLVNGKTYNVTGVYVQYDETKEITPRSAEDIVLVEVINKYVVTIETPENGTLTVKDGETVINSGDEVAEGTTLTIECTPANEDYRFQNWQYKVGDGSWTPRYTNPQDYTMPSANVQFKANFELIPTYTVAWSVNGSVVKTEDLKEGATVTAPEVTVPEYTDKVFTGWVEISTVAADATPAYVTPSETAAKNVTYYAVFASETQGTAVDKTATVNIGSYAAANSWTDATKYTSVSTEELTIEEGHTASSATNNGKYYTLNNTWRFYQSEGGSFTITSLKGNMKSVTLTYSIKESGSGNNKKYPKLYYNEAEVTSGNQINIAANTTSAVFTVRGDGGNIQVSQVEVIYTGTGSTYSDFCTTVAAPAPTTGNFKFVASAGNGVYYATFSSNRVVKFNETFVNDAETCLAEIKAYFVTADNRTGKLTRTDLYDEYNDGNHTYIPANTGVLLKYTLGDGTFDGTVPFEYADEWDGYLPEVIGNNLYPASQAKDMEFFLYYKLAYGDAELTPSTLGFYWGAENGAAFESREGSAYLAFLNPANAAPTHFLFEEEETAVENVEATAEAVKFIEEGNLYIQKNGRVYNAMGQLVK